jgi:cell division initiation protein
MEMLPNDVRQHRFKKSVRGYDTDEVDQFLEHLATVLEDALTARQSAEEVAARYEQDVNRFREQESALKRAVLTVEQAMASARDSSVKELETLKRSAEVKARQIIHEAEMESRGLEQDMKFLKESRQGMIEQIRAFCRAQLATLDTLDRPDRAREAARQAVMPKRAAPTLPPRPPAPAVSVSQPAPLAKEPDPEPTPESPILPAAHAETRDAKPWQPERITRSEIDEKLDSAIGDTDDGAADKAVAYPPPLVPTTKSQGDR